MPNAFLYGVGGGKLPTLAELSVSANGTYNASDYSVDGFSVVNVNVSGGDDSDQLTKFFRGNLTGTLDLGDYSGSLILSSNNNNNISKINYNGSSAVSLTSFIGLQELSSPNLSEVPYLAGCLALTSLTLASEAYLSSFTLNGQLAGTQILDWIFPNASLGGYNYMPSTGGRISISCSSAFTLSGRPPVLLEFNMPNLYSLSSRVFDAANTAYLLSFNIENCVGISTSNVIGGVFSTFKLTKASTTIGVSLGNNIYNLEFGNLKSFGIYSNTNGMWYLKSISTSTLVSLYCGDSTISVIESLPDSLRYFRINSPIIFGSEMSIIRHSYLTELYLGASCSTIFGLELPELTSLYGPCPFIENVNCPKITTLSTSAFYSNNALSSISLPNLERIGSYCFYSCNALTSITLYCSTIGNDCFSLCRNLISVTLLNDSVCALGTGCFLNSPISQSYYLGFYGSIYVPSSLYNDYITATNWVAYSSRIVAIGD